MTDETPSTKALRHLDNGERQRLDHTLTLLDGIIRSTRIALCQDEAIGSDLGGALVSTATTAALQIAKADAFRRGADVLQNAQQKPQGSE